jgi:hypothetical protein
MQAANYSTFLEIPALLIQKSQNDGNLGLFVQTSPYGLGLHKKDFGPIFLCKDQASEANKKLII